MPTPAPHLNDIIQAVSIKYNNLVYDMKSRGDDVIVLSLGEAFFDIPLFSFHEMPFPASYHYSHSRGIPELRTRLADYYRQQHGVPVDPDTEIIVTAGSKIAIHMSLMAILSPADQVVVLEPAWVSYPAQVRLCHAVPVMVPRDRTVFDLDEFIMDRTKAIIINNPNNPSGRVLSARELEHFHTLAEKHELFLLSDEAYSDFLLDDAFMSAGSLDPEKRHTIVCNSMSKNFGMSGWRIGYTICNRTLIDEVLKINQHLVTCPATILQHYVAKHFDDILTITKPQIAQVVRQRRRIGNLMDACGMSYLPGDGTFYFFVSIAPSTLTSDSFCTRLLREHRVSTVPGIGYGRSCDRFIRVSVGAESIERIERGMRIINRLIRETS